MKVLLLRSTLFSISLFPHGKSLRNRFPTPFLYFFWGCLYLLPRTGGAQSCPDLAPCGGDAQLTSTCTEACVVCDLDGFVGNNYNLGFTELVPPGFCAQLPNSVGWIAFTTATSFLELGILVDNCISNGEGLQFGVYKSDNCQNFTQIGNCNPFAMPGYHYWSTDQPLQPGQILYLVVDGVNDDRCSFQIDVLSGSTLAPPIPSQLVDFSVPNTICPGGLLDVNVLDIPPYAGEYEWTLDGQFAGCGLYPNITIPSSLGLGDSTELCLTVSHPCNNTLPTTCKTIAISYNPPIVDWATICEGESYDFFGFAVTQSGVYNFEVTGADNCVQEFVLILEVLPTDMTVVDTLACMDDLPIIIAGEPLSAPPGLNEFTLVTTGQDGCDSVITVNLTVVAPAFTQVVNTICDGETVAIGDSLYSETGTYQTLLSSAAGCDSLVVLVLFVNPSPATDLDTILLSPGDVYVFDGDTLRQPGSYEYIFPTAEGCDSTVTFFLAYPEPGNDRCSGAVALDLGSPVDCPGGGEVRDTIATDNFGATASTPFLRLPCGAAGLIDGNGADSWYRFTAPGNLLSLRLLESTISELDWVLYRLDDQCSNRLPVYCGENLPPIDYPILDLEVERGAEYLLQVIGSGPEAQGFLTFELIADQHCDPCRREGRLTVSPPPVDGAYQSGQTVEICYELTRWESTTDDIRLNALIPSYGAVWDLTTLNAAPPAPCSGQGDWAYYDAPWTSESSGLPFGPGFGYTNPGAPGPGFSTGDGPGDCAEITAGDAPRTFCWSLVVGGDPDSCSLSPVDGASVAALPYSNAVTGVAGEPECASPLVLGYAQFYATAICCDDSPPAILLSQGPSCSNFCDGRLDFSGGGDGPWQYRLYDENGLIVETWENAAGSVSRTGLCAGVYQIEATDLTNGCRRTVFDTLSAPGDFLLPQISGPEGFCPGDSVLLSATDYPLADAVSYLWNTGDTTADITVNTPGVYAVTVTVDNCTGEAAADVTEFVPPPATIDLIPDATPCSADSFVLAAPAGAYQYLWNTGDTTAAIDLAITTPQTFGLTLTDVNNCQDSASRTIAPLALPLAEPATLSTCDDGNGQGVFDLTQLENTVGGGLSVNWFADSDATQLISGPSAFLSPPATVFAVVDDGACASEPAPVTLELLSPPAPPVISCPIRTVTSTTFQWANDPAVADYTVIGPPGELTGRRYKVTGLNPGETVQIEVIATDSAGCQSSQVWSCTAADCEDLEANSDILSVGFCETDTMIYLVDLLFFAEGNGAGAWSGPGLIDPSGVFNPSLVGPGEFTFDYNYSEGGCETAGIQILQVEAQPEPPAITCQPGIGQVLFSWASDPAALIFNVTPLNGPTFSQGDTSFLVTGLAPGEEASIAVTAEAAGGCQDTTSVAACAALFSCDDLAIAIEPAGPFCQGDVDDVYTLSGTVTAGVGNEPWLWSGPGLIDGLDTPNPTFSPLVAGIGQIAVTATYFEDGCQVSESLIIEVIDTPDAALSADVPSGGLCPGDPLTITPVAQGGNLNYTWNFDGGAATFPDDPNVPVVAWDNPGEKTVTLVVNNGSCVSDTAFLSLTVAPTLDMPQPACSATQTSITFSWPAVPGASGYHYETDTGLSGAQADTSLTLTGLAPGDGVTLSVMATGTPCAGPVAEITCNSQGCPDVAIQIDPPGPLCLDGSGTTFALTATVAGDDGSGMLSWSGDGVIDPVNGLFDPALVGTGATLVTVNYANGPCTYTADFSITVNAPVQLNAIQADCADDTAYTVSAEVIAGPDTFDYVSDPIPSGETAELTFNQSPGCPPAVITLTKNCDCETAVGGFSTNGMMSLCENEILLLDQPTQLELTPDDTWQYVVHTNSGNVPGEVIARFAGPEITFQAGMAFGTTYWVSPVAGPDQGDGSVDLTDPCVAVAPGQPFVFLPAPDLTVGADPVICPGQAADLTAQSQAAIAYQWTPLDGLSCDLCASPVAQPDTTTTYQIVAAGPNGCEAQESVTVYVGEFPGYSVPDVDPVCPGQPYELCLPPAQSYLWTGPGGYVSTSPCLIFNELTPEFTGVYTVTIQLDDQCVINETIDLSAAPPVIVSDFPEDTTVCPLALVPLTTDIEGAAGYRWFPEEAVFCNTCPSTAAMVYKDTRITLLIFDENGCTYEETFDITIDDNCGGIGSYIDILFPPPGPTPEPLPAITTELELYPNPAREWLTIALNDRSPIKAWAVFDVNGALIASKKDLQSRKERLSLHDFTPGTYLIRVVTEAQTFNAKFVRGR